jgi:hypothetical protein
VPSCLSRCVSVSVSLPTLEQISRLELYEIQSEGQALEGEFDVILVSTVASIIQKWWKFKCMKYDRCKTCISQRGLLNIRILIDLQKKRV